MLQTFLTTTWNLQYPIIGAPMAYAGAGRLAHAVSRAGALGMIGIGSKHTPEFIGQQATIARGEDGQPFGFGLMAWALLNRPELLAAAIQEKPFLVSISFGSPAPYVERLHDHEIYLATQVHSREEALQAEDAGVDLIVAQGTEAGGHTGQVSTLPLLQTILEAVRTPVLAAGGVASPRGVAAALAAGADGVWIGTRLLAAHETEASEMARERILQAKETDTILTSAFDVAQRLAWPPQYKGRALSNQFTDRWHNHTDQLATDEAARQQLAEAIRQEDYNQAYIYAGEGVGLVNEKQSAVDIIQQMGVGAEALVRERYRTLLHNNSYQ